jgi:hypothetical protein
MPVVPDQEPISHLRSELQCRYPAWISKETIFSPRSNSKAYSGSVSILTLPLGQCLDFFDSFTTKRPFLPSGPSCQTTKLDDIMAPVLRILSACPVVTSLYMPSWHPARRSSRPNARSSGGLRNRVHDFAAAERDGGLLQNPELNGTAKELRCPKQSPRLDSLLRREPSWRPSAFRDY